MELEDRINVTTPEGIELSLALAGPGSRVAAGLIDLLLKFLLILVIGIVGAIVSLGGLFFVLALFIVYYGYDVLFETRAAGRTPGKRWTGLRVVTMTGGSVDLASSAIRNICRLIDGLTLLYVPTLISIMVTERNQRIGDLAASTLVIRERRAAQLATAPNFGHGPIDTDWDVTAITDSELATLRRFLARRDTLEIKARAALAEQLYAALRPKVAGAPDGIPSEEFLERLARARSA